MFMRSKKLPVQDIELLRKVSLRWMRAAGPHNEWAKVAKECTDFLEGNQWTPEQKAFMHQISRSALTINKIAPLWRLVMGYQQSNRMDTSFLPTSDSQSSEDVAKVITALFKVEALRTDLRFTDSEVFADGLTTGRGFWNVDVSFEENDLGEIRYDVDDPFSIYIDPDCSTYDVRKTAGYITKSVWTDCDTVNAQYGSEAAYAVENLMSPTYSSNLLTFLGEQDISPKRFFGQYADDKANANWNDIFQNDFLDNQAKRIRLLDSQYKVTQIMPCFIDLETGTMKPVPTEWLEKEENHYKIQQCLDYGNELGNPVEIRPRPVKRVRRTVSCADVTLFDGWSLYDDYTTIGFFPYFRRGKTRGFIEDLLDPQREINKKRSVLVDILNRNANSGWIYEENSLDADQKENLRNYGSAPGINVEYKRTATGAEPPKRLEPGNYPQGLDRLEEKASEDLNIISGINESALGQLDRVQSGRAIEARQRQAVLSIQMYSDNFSRSKKLQGKASLSIFQNFYTEERIFRDLGEDSKLVMYEINKKIETGTNSFSRLNDITVGKYSTSIDETPISATFKQGQFEETMMLLEKLGPIGMMLAQSSPDLIIDQTSLPRKNDWKQALMSASAMTPPEVAMAGGSAGKQMPVGPAAGTPEKMAS